MSRSATNLQKCCHEEIIKFRLIRRLDGTIPFHRYMYTLEKRRSSEDYYLHAFLNVSVDFREYRCMGVVINYA